MKWYGYSSYNLINFKKKNKINFKKKLSKNALLLTKKINNNLNNLNLFIPFGWNFIIFKKSSFKDFIYLYIFNSIYFFLLPISKKFLFLNYDYNLNFINFKFIFLNNFYFIFFNFYKNIFFSFSKLFFIKIKFKGKGYYIYKNNRNTIALQFGYSHLYYLYSFFITVKFLTKTNILMFGINKNDITYSSNMLYKIKPINIFTGKGIRFSRQIIYRKTGKISSYR